MWAAVVPARLLRLVVCLACFDQFAREQGVLYATSVDSLYFAGEQATFEFSVRFAGDG